MGLFGFLDRIGLPSEARPSAYKEVFKSSLISAPASELEFNARVLGRALTRARQSAVKSSQVGSSNVLAEFASLLQG